MTKASFAPRGSERQLFLSLLRWSSAHPLQIHRRVNRFNVRQWREFRGRRMSCNLCGHSDAPLYEMPDLVTLRRHHIGPLRETLRCRSCWSKMRERTVTAAMTEVFAQHAGMPAGGVDNPAHRTENLAGLRVLDTDAYGRVARRLGHLGEYRTSLFDPAVPNGQVTADGIINVDLEDMPFEDNSFDLIVTSEVMEHVRFADKAHREIARCLAPGGTYLFTVPYDDRLPNTWRLIDPETDEELVSPPHIHGDDPRLRTQGIKSYRVFGRDIVGDLARCGLDAAFTPVHRPEIGVYGGDVFVATAQR